jgi:hypothetical protein
MRLLARAGSKYMTENRVPPGKHRAQARPTAPPQRASGRQMAGVGYEQQPSRPASVGRPGPGIAAPVLRSHSRAWWVTSGIVAVLILLGSAGIWHLATAHRAGSIVLPGMLLRLSRNTGPRARAYASNAENKARGSLLTAPVAAVYGEFGRGFVVVTGAPCTGGTCVVGTGDQLAQAFRAHGYPDARSFPPGPGGILMVCISRTLHGAQPISCEWLSQVTAGLVAFSGGFASNLADAAAQTRQIRATIEH